MISCADIAVRRVGGILSATLNRQGEGVSLRTERKGGMMSFRVEDASRMSSPAIKRIGEAVRFKCNIVCSDTEPF